MKRDVLLSMTPKHGLDLTRSLEIDPAKYWVWTNFNSYQQDLTPSTFFNLCNFSTMRITISTLALAFVLPTALCSPQLVAPFMKCPVDLVDRCLAKAGPPDLLTIALPERICTTEDDFIECLECGCEEVQTLREMGQEECEKIVKLFFGGPM
ncbi:hypothetical protein BC832DRAFT_592058 [Gaertneriomyces semiglobifer]|nr:hypothetical protein BC832DRAFT_592058 [Gaertneriomyces semiglobifer]